MVKKYKLCSKYNRLFPETTEYFYRNKMTPSGLRDNCKRCYEEYQREYDKKNKEKIKKKI